MSKQFPRTAGDGRWRLLALLVANGIAQAAAAIVAALAVERVFTMLGRPDPPRFFEIALLGAALTATAVVTAFLRGRERIDAERLGQSYTHQVRLALFEHLTEMSPRSVQERSQGSTALRFVGDLTMLRRWVSLGLARLVVGITMTVGALIALAWVGQLLAVVAAVTIAVGVAATLTQGAHLRSTTGEARRRRSRLAGNVTEQIAAVGAVQAHGGVRRERRRVARQSERLRDAMIVRARHLGRVEAIAEATALAATSAVLLAALVTGVPAPTVAASMVVVGLIAPQLRGLGRVQEYWQGVRVARDAIDRFLARPASLHEASDAPRLLPGPGLLVLDGLGLGDTIVDASAIAEPGQVVAIIGANGAGKSTLLSLIARLLDPDRGRVLLDGQDLSTVALNDVRRAIGLVAPDLPLMRGSLRRNLTYRRPDISDDELSELIDRCGLRELVDSAPEGLDLPLTEAGRNLSSGERQRVQLARALVGAPSLLLLDEADANLDESTSELVDQAIRAREGTTLLITHRKERLSVADVVWQLDGGCLIEIGSPEALLSAGGPAASLFKPIDVEVTA